MKEVMEDSKKEKRLMGGIRSHGDNYRYFLFLLNIVKSCLLDQLTEIIHISRESYDKIWSIIMYIITE